MKIKKIEAQPQEVKKLRVAAYCRVSTDNDDQKESLEAQKAHYETWIKRHSNWDFAGIFYDFGITGTKADLYDGQVVNGRMRITNSASNCGKTPAGSYVTGWVNKADI